jgi:iron-sulfur cluster assembly accessory protein
MKLTEAAISKVEQLIENTRIAMPSHEIFLRVTVMPGGCSGLKHQTYFDYEKRSNDHIFRYQKFDLRVDDLSLPYLEGATIDYYDTIEKQGFFLDNPNATGTCSCGDSFH